MEQVRVSQLLTTLPDDGWRRLSAGAGAKGPRWYKWQLVTLNRPLLEKWFRWLLVRRLLDDPSAL